VNKLLTVSFKKERERTQCALSAKTSEDYKQVHKNLIVIPRD
jgi:hypothetical protein